MKTCKSFKDTLYSEKIEKIITETAGLIKSTGMKIQEIFIQTADNNKLQK